MQSPYEHRLLQVHTYAIVDRQAAPDLPPGLPLIALTGQGLEPQAHLLPWLLPLREASPAQLDALFDSMVGQPVGQAPPIRYLMQAPGDPETVARRVSRRMVLAQRHEGRFLLRYADPRVWSQILWMLAPEQLAYWVDYARRVTFWLQGQWHSVEPTQTAVPLRPNNPPALSYPTFSRIARVGAINDVLAEQPAPSTPPAHQALSRRIDDLLDRALNAHRLADEKDRAAFALHGIQVGASFDSHPLVRRLLESLAGNETTYRDASALLSMSDWQRISADLT